MNLANPRNWARYTRELPDYLRGRAKATALWGDTLVVPFPENRCVVENGLIDQEEAIYEYLNEHLKTGEVLWDVGANVGFYSLLGAHKGAEVFAFEPVPATYKVLSKNLLDTNAKAFQYAVSDHNGTAWMDGIGITGHNQILEKGNVLVKTIKLDDALNFASIPTIIKIDVEGHDLEAIKGAEKLLTTYGPAVILECNQSMDYMIGLGYKATLLGPKKKRNFLFTKV